MATSYSNFQGSGARPQIAVSCSPSSMFTAGYQNIAELVNGGNNNTLYFTNTSIVGGTITFDFKYPQKIDEFTWVQSAAGVNGVWNWQGSNDATTWDTLTTNITLGTAVSTVVPVSCPKMYRYFRLLGVSGTGNTAPRVYEMNFKIDDALPNPQLVASGSLYNWYTAFTSPLTAPVTYQDGDIIVFHVMSNASLSSYVPGNGFTLVGNTQNTSSISFYYKKLSGSGTSVQLPGLSGSGAVYYLLFRNVYTVQASGVYNATAQTYVASGKNLILTIENRTVANFQAQGYTIYSNPTWGNTNFTPAWKSFYDSASVPASVSWGPSYPYIIFSLNSAPIPTLTTNLSVTFQTDIRLTGTITDPENDLISYRIYVGSNVLKDWTDLKAGPITVDFTVPYTALAFGPNSIIVETKDSSGYLSRTFPYAVTRKDSDITSIAYATQNTNFLNDQNKISSTDTVLMNIDLVPSNGYINKSSLVLNVLLGTVGTVKIGLIESIWDPRTVTYVTRPVFDTNFITATIALGVNTIDITPLAKLLYSQSNYGIYITSDVANIVLSPTGNGIDVIYQPTELNQPQVVYGDRCKLSWKPMIFYKPEAIQLYQIWRDTDPTFATEICVFQTANKDVLTFLDTGLSLGTYYYRMKVVFIHNSYVGTQLDFDVADKNLFKAQDLLTAPDFVSGAVRAHLLSGAHATNYDFNDVTSYDHDSSMIISDGTKVILTSTGSDDSYTVLLVHGDGTEGDTAFKESRNKNFTGSGNAKVTTSLSKIGGSCLYAPNSTSSGGDYFYTTDNLTDFDFGTGDFTIDFWLYPTGYGSGGLYGGYISTGHGASTTTNNWIVRFLSSGPQLTFEWNNGSVHRFTTASGITLNTWTHIAFVRYGDSFKIYLNGVLDASFTGFATYNILGSGYGLYLFRSWDSGYPQYDGKGYMDEIRISKGIARWTSNFTPSLMAYSERLYTSGVQKIATPTINTSLESGISSIAITDSSTIATNITNIKNMNYVSALGSRSLLRYKIVSNAVDYKN